MKTCGAGTASVVERMKTESTETEDGVDVWNKDNGRHSI
jgi:hypothetical protein